MNHVPVWSLYLSLQWWNLNKPRCWRGLGDLETHLLGCWGLFVSRAQDVAADLSTIRSWNAQVVSRSLNRQFALGPPNNFSNQAPVSAANFHQLR